MERNLCVYLDFLTEAHKERLSAAAEAAGFGVRFFGRGQFEEARAFVQGCEVLFAHSPSLVRAAPAGLKWYCCSYAGVEPYCKGDGIFQNPECLLSNSSGAYGETISEHLLMTLLMLLRRMPYYEAAMGERRWPEHVSVRSLLGSRITVLGTGNIGTTFAKKARALGAERILGVNRSGTARDGVYDAVLPLSRLDQALPETEILVMALPGTPETDGVLSRERIALLGPEALVANVGRGAAIDQAALIEALNAGRIAGAALDVMTSEPLEPEDPLWSARNVILTPHVSGNTTLGVTCDTIVGQFCADLERYAAGQAPAHLVDRSRGY